MNALLMSEVEPDAVELQGEEEEVHCHIPGDVRLVDEQALELRNGAARVTLLHQSLMPKPWMGDAWRNLQKNPYVRLAPRVLFDDDVPLRLDSRAVPAWPRRGGGSPSCHHGRSNAAGGVLALLPHSAARAYACERNDAAVQTSFRLKPLRREALLSLQILAHGDEGRQTGQIQLGYLDPELVF
jgi:hypothetical protein